MEDRLLAPKPSNLVVLPSEDTVQDHEGNREERLVMKIRIDLPLFRKYGKTYRDNSKNKTWSHLRINASVSVKIENQGPFNE